MNEVTVNEFFPIAEFYTEQAPRGPYSYGDSNYSRSVTPYGHLDTVLRVIKERNITVPFEKIITRYEGISACNKCGAKYVGFQNNCSAPAWKYITKSYYGKHRGNVCVNTLVGGDRVSSCDLVSCDEQTTWDLQKEFSAQEDFFSFISFLDTLPKRHEGWLKQYKDTLPPGAAEEYRTLAMEKTIQELVFQTESLTNALKQVAQKMNSAGHSLTF